MVIAALVAIAVIAAAVVVVVLATRGGSSNTASNSSTTSSRTSSSSSSSSSSSTKTTSTQSSTSSSETGTGNLILPDSIAGEPRLANSTLDNSLQAEADSVRRAGASGAVAGAYGTNPSLPDRAVFAASGNHPVTPDYTKLLVDQFAQGAGVAVDDTSMQVIDENGVQISCWALDRSGTGVAAFCAWNDVETVGFTVQLQDPSLRPCADFTGAARRAILNQG